MFKRSLVTLLCCFTTSVMAAVPKGICPTGADGRWVIVSVRPYSDITALSWDEAHAYVGKTVFVSDREVNYAGTPCEVVNKRESYSVGKFGDVPGFPYGLIYDCRNTDTFIPGFEVGKWCDRITSGLDGWRFQLRRPK